MVFNTKDILFGAGAILIVYLVAIPILAPLLATAGVVFPNNNGLLVTFVGMALIMGIALGVYDLVASGTGFTFSKFIPLVIAGIMLFLTIKYGMPLIANLSPSAASVFPIA